MHSYLIRELTGLTREPRGVTCTLRAVACAVVPGMPGYVTGEPYDVQGIETGLPNLPRLEPPAADGDRELVLRLVAVADDTMRIVVVPAGETPDDGRALGIVTDPYPGEAEVTVRETPETVELSTDRLRVCVGRSPFSLRVEDRVTGTTVLRTAERLRQAAGLPMAPALLAESGHLSINLELAADEDVLGFGEQFSAVVKNGQHLMLSVADALGTGTGQAYKPVPVWHSTAGYTGLLNTGAVVDADVGHTRPSVLDLNVHDASLDLYVVVGDDPRSRLGAYTRLTGRGRVPPLWAFGYWMGRCRYHSRDEMLDVAASMRDHRVPCDVLHLDPDWLVVDRLNCDFIWNAERFGDRRAFVDDLAAQGLRLSVWELPYLDPMSPRYQEAERNGYLVKGPDGATAHVAGTPTPDGRHRALVDFTNPDAARWWQRLHAEFLDDGVAVFKTDFGEGLPDDTVLSDGTPPRHAHNLYPLRYNAAVSDGIAEHTGRAPLVWGRSGWAGSHRYPGQWGGDAESTVAGMQATLRGGLSYAMSAPGLWSHDIGGFFGPELTPALYVRWTQFGAFSPLMRAHGLRPREPWAFDGATLELARTWVRRRYELLGCLWQAAHDSMARGLPMLRPMMLEFPDDPVCSRIDSQFLLGSDLLVVPVFADEPGPTRRRFYVAGGRWTDLFTGEEYEGPGFVTRTLALDAMPVLVRDGAVVPRIDIDDSVRNTDDLVGRAWTLHVYGGDRRQSVELVGFDGTALTAELDGETVAGHGSQPLAPAAVRYR